MKLLLILWQLPQALLGWLCSKFICLFYGKGKRVYHSCSHPGISFIVHEKLPGAMSLWPFIFLWCDAGVIPATVSHEYGHTIQSRILGWFYLPVVGVHSLLGILLKHLLHKDNDWYHKLPFEAWADKLGGTHHE